MRKLRTILVIMLCWGMEGIAQPETLTLNQAITEGLTHSSIIQNAKLEQQKYQSQLRQTQSQLYPKIEAFSDFVSYYAQSKLIVPGEIFGQEGDIVAEFGTKYTWNSGLRTTQVIYNQSLFTMIRIARESLVLGELSVRLQQQTLVYQITQAYYLCQTTSRQIAHLATNMNNMEQLLKITGLQEKQGVIRQVDHEQLVVDKNNLQTEIEQLELLHAKQLTLLKYLIGAPVELELVLSDSLKFEEINPVKLLPAMENRVEVLTLDKQIELSALVQKMEKQRYWPVINGVVHSYYEGQRDAFDFFEGGERFSEVGFIGLSLSVPVFDGFARKEKVKQQELQLKQIQNERENQLNYFKKEYLDAWQLYTRNKAAVLRQQANIQIAEKNYTVSLLGYQQHTLSLTDLIRTQNSLTKARLAYDSALFQLKIAELELKKSTGELLNETY